MRKSIKFVLATSLLLAFGLVSCDQVFPNPNEQGSQTNNDRLVTNVTLSEEYREVDVDDTFTLTPTITYKDGQTVEVTKRWGSSNSRVATISNEGLVTAIKPGTAYISYIAGLKKAICEVRVRGDDVVPTDPDEPGPEPGGFTITLSDSEISLMPLETYTLTATTSEPATVSWSSEDTSVATVTSEGVVEGVAEGYTTIKATANGQTAKCVVNVSEEDYAKNISVYFFIDYNNVDANDKTATEDPVTHEKTGGEKLLAYFKWYGDRPISESGKVPANLAQSDAMDPAFPYFIGWSSHTIIDTVDDLWTMDTDLIGSSLSFIYFYGIWSDVQVGGYPR